MKYGISDMRITNEIPESWQERSGDGSLIRS